MGLQELEESYAHAPIIRPDATVRFPMLLQKFNQDHRYRSQGCFLTYPVFSVIHAMFSGCVDGQDATATAAEYFRPRPADEGRLRRKIQPNSCHPAAYKH